MKNLIVNLTATGSYIDLPTVPHSCLSITLQARTAVDMQYRYEGQATFWTIKSDTSRTLIGEFDQADIQVQAVADTIIEIEYSTIGYEI